MKSHLPFRSDPKRWFTLSLLLLGVSFPLWLQPGLVRSQPQPAQPSRNQPVRPVTFTLEFRLQKPGTQKQWRETMRRYQDLQREAKQPNRSMAAQQVTERAIAQAEQVLLNLYGPAGLDARDVRQVEVEDSTGIPEINVRFQEPSGSRKFAQMTKQIAGTERTIGVFVNGRLISAPVVPKEYARTGITGGMAVIAGSFRSEEAKRLVQLMNQAVLTVKDGTDAQ